LFVIRAATAAPRSWGTDVQFRLRRRDVLPGTIEGTGRYAANRLPAFGRATSAAANYEEAKAAYSRKDFALKNSIVLKELREADLWLRVILRCHIGTPQAPAALRIESDQLVAIFTSSMRKLHPAKF
jgi:hypothetical protein